MRASLLLTGLLFAACATSDPTGDADATTTDDAAAEVAGGCAFTPPEGWPCDPVCDTGCAEGQTCTWTNGAFGCLEAGAAGLDEACSPDGPTCASGACLTPSGGGPAVCRAFCVDHEDCPDTRPCDGVLQSDGPVMACGDPLSSCDVLLQDCAGAAGCYLSQKGAVCLPPGQLLDGAACHYTNDCRPGSGCVVIDAQTTCAPLCDLAEPFSDGGCEVACPETFGEVSGVPGVGFCAEEKQPVPCDLLLQDCPAGQGCYYGGDGVSCHPTAADLGAGEACQYANGCAAGLICVNGACHELCAPQTPECPPARPACDELPDVAGAGVCTSG
jgi:hypothetical protein